MAVTYDLELIYRDGSDQILLQVPQSHRLAQGVHERFRFRVRNSAGTAIDLTLWSLVYTLKGDVDDTEELISRAASYSDAGDALALGIGSFKFSPSDTVTQLDPEILPRPGPYIADVRATLPDGITKARLMRSSTVQLDPMVGEPGSVPTPPAVYAGSLIAGALQARVYTSTAFALTGLPIVDTVQLVAGDVVLRNVSTPEILNGLWVASATAWTRLAAFPSGSKAAGVVVVVQEGSPANRDTLWLCSTNRPTDVIGTDVLAFVNAGGAGGNVPAIGTQGAVDIEDPAGTITRRRATFDDIDPAFSGAFSGTFAAARALSSPLVDPQFTFTASSALSAVAGDVTVTDEVDTQNIVPPTSPFGYGAPGLLTSRSYVTSVRNASKTWDLKLTKLGGAPVVHRFVSVQFQAPAYFGKSASLGPYNASFITGLSSGAVLAAAPQRDIATTTGAGEFVFYVYPAADGGTPSDFIDVATGFPFGVTKVAASVSVDNGFGVFVLHDVWRSDFPNLGATTMRRI